jgi:photosystem II stability/assembly factor-like uncharacterized protein
MAAICCDEESVSGRAPSLLTPRSPLLVQHFSQNTSHSLYRAPVFAAQPKGTTMIFARSLLSLALLLFANTASAGNGSWVSNGPDGANLQALVLSTANSSVLYAGADGAYRSGDGAASWQPAPGFDGAIRGLAVDPTDADVVYAATPAGVLKSTDGGATSAPSNSGLNSTNVFSIAVAPDDAQAVLAGTNLGVSRSSDGGASWTPQSSGLPVNIYRVLLPIGGGVVFAAAGNRVYRSGDGGATWGESSTGLPGQEVRVLAVDPSDAQVLWAGLSFSLYRSGDGGASWMRMDTGIVHLNANGVGGVAVDPSDGRIVYAGVQNGGLFKTLDGGASWERAEDGLSNRFIRAVAVDPSGTQTVYAATNGRGVFKSSDGGASWEPAASGLRQINQTR